MKAKILGLLAAGLLAAPIALQAAVIGPGQYQDWVFDLSAHAGDLSFSQGGYSAAGEDPLGVDARISFSFGSAVGLSDFGTGMFTNNAPEPVHDAAGSIFGATISVPSTYDALFVRVSYVDDAFGFDKFRIQYERHAYIDGARLPEPETLALLGLGLAGLGLSRRRKTH